MPFFPNTLSCQKKLSSEYQLYVGGNFLGIPRLWKKLLFSDNLLEIQCVLASVRKEITRGPKK